MRDQIDDVLSGGVAPETNILSALAQLGVRYVVQQGLEQEPADHLGRGRYERGAGAKGLRNGYPRFTDERSAMKLVFAALIRCSQRWNRAWITDMERHQLKLLRAELEIDLPPESKGGPLEKEDRVTQVAASIRRSGLDRAAVRAEYLAAVAQAM